MHAPPDKQVFALKIYHDSKDNIKKRKSKQELTKDSNLSNSPSSSNWQPSMNDVEEFKLDDKHISHSQQSHQSQPPNHSKVSSQQSSLQQAPHHSLSPPSLAG